MIPTVPTVPALSSGVESLEVVEDAAVASEGMTPLTAARAIPYALYCSSIIIGAGILSLPVLVAKIGLIPAVTLAAVLGIGLAAIYVRIARGVHDYVVAHVQISFDQGRERWIGLGVSPDDCAKLASPVLEDEAERKGIGLLDEMCGWLGFGHAGQFALFVGLLAYVLPACVGYVTVGGKTLSAIAGLLLSLGVPPLAPVALAAAVAAASFLTVRVLPRFRGRATLSIVLQMMASWFAVVALLMLVGLDGWVPVLLFAAGTVGVILRSSAEDATTTTHSLSAQHRVGTIIAVVELLMLAATAGFAVYIVIQNHVWVTPPWVVPSLTPSDVAVTIGVLLFAYVGTGIFNLIRYPQLFEQRAGRGAGLPLIVGLGTLIPAVAYIGWMLAIAFALSPEVLLAADRSTSYPTIPLADKVAALGGLGWLVVGAGYFVALLAVTGAGTGFSESLADRLVRIGNAARRRGTTVAAPGGRSVRLVQAGVLLVAAAIAGLLAVQTSALSFTALLTVAGNAGGGLLLLVIPFFLPSRGRRHSRKREVALATLLALLLMALNLAALPAGMGTDPEAMAVGIVILGIDLLFFIAWLGLVWGENPIPEQQPGEQVGT